MPKNGFKVLDSDMHILEPPDLWQRFIDSKFKDYAPRGTTDHVRDLRLVGPDGRSWGRPNRRSTPRPSMSRYRLRGPSY